MLFCASKVTSAEGTIYQRACLCEEGHLVSRGVNICTIGDMSEIDSYLAAYCIGSAESTPTSSPVISRNGTKVLAGYSRPYTEWISVVDAVTVSTLSLL